ncbi:hypothetical protein [Aquimarina sediminis]|uniref:hypothetical protein n=1 Tax=Aquimarina sediminis TaxID=2070536 RepID=UPI000CA0183B|nr:hypothetical protein [Aquimarina sediminis]
MKKKLEAELISIAHRILQLKDKATIPRLQEEARELYEKLTILSFSESHFAGPQPTIGQIRAVLDTNEPAELKEVKQEVEEIIAPEPTHPVEEEKLEENSIEVLEKKEEEKDKTVVESKPEIIIEEINARVTEDLFVPATAVTKEGVDFSEPVVSQDSFEKNDKDDVTPTAQDISFSDKIDNDERPKSLNDQLRKEIHIGLNDRLAFIKYLFEGNASDYNRVLSQLSTLRGKKEAEEFITTMIKPDYNNWKDKEEYEERFMNIVLSKFDH